MKRLGPAFALALVVFVVLALRARNAPAPTPAPAAPSTSTSAPAAPWSATPVAPTTPSTRADRLLVPGVSVRDLDGRIAWRGDVDLHPALARIERGERDEHRSDGEVFGNREHRLPEQPRGWYREYVVRTPGLRGPGPQRLVLGKDGAAFYTSDHYATFTQVRGAR
jgi:filamentous hemagglutinin